MEVEEVITKQDIKQAGPVGEYIPTPPKERSRRVIAFIAVVAYVCLLFVNVLLPILLYWFNRSPDQVIEISDVKDLTLAISSALSGLVGILGFIMGYYFKAAEQEQEREEALQAAGE